MTVKQFLFKLMNENTHIELVDTDTLSDCYETIATGAAYQIKKSKYTSYEIVNFDACGIYDEKRDQYTSSSCLVLYVKEPQKTTTTREAVNKLTDNQRAHLECIVSIANYCENVYAEKEKIRCKIEGYCQCLKDIGALTEYERKMVYLYYRSKIAYESDKNKKQ